MRSWCAVYVDVGYLLASAATRVTGSSLRSGIEVDYPGLIAGIVAQVERDSGLPLLRVNWYDSGARQGGQPDWHQDQIGHLPRIKLRLGRLSYAGEQKGVDVRLGLDLALQGRARVADVVYLVSGDDDLTEAVEEAQGAGVQVVLLSVPGASGEERGHAVSKHLRRAADGEITVETDIIDAFVRSRALAEGLVPKKDHDGDDLVEQTEAALGDSLEGIDERDVAAASEQPLAQEVGEPVQDGGQGDGGAQGEGGAQAVAEGDDGSVARTGGAATGDQDSAAGALDPESSSSADSSPVPDRPAASVQSTQRTPSETSGQSEPPASSKPSTSSTASKTPALPTPSVFGSKRASEVVLPGAAPTWDRPVDEPLIDGDGTHNAVLIDSVAKNVVASWCRTATPADLTALRESKPTIPGDLDRALLLDLAGRAGEYDIDEASRHAVRARFWFHVARVRLA